MIHEEINSKTSSISKWIPKRFDGNSCKGDRNPLLVPLSKNSQISDTITITDENDLSPCKTSQPHLDADNHMARKAAIVLALNSRLNKPFHYSKCTTSSHICLDSHYPFNRLKSTNTQIQKIQESSTNQKRF